MNPAYNTTAFTAQTATTSTNDSYAGHIVHDGLVVDIPGEGGGLDGGIMGWNEDWIAPAPDGPSRPRANPQQDVLQNVDYGTYDMSSFAPHHAVQMDRDQSTSQTGWTYPAYPDPTQQITFQGQYSGPSNSFYPNDQPVLAYPSANPAPQLTGYGPDGGSGSLPSSATISPQLPLDQGAIAPADLQQYGAPSWFQPQAPLPPTMYMNHGDPSQLGWHQYQQPLLTPTLAQGEMTQQIYGHQPLSNSTTQLSIGEASRGLSRASSLSSTDKARPKRTVSDAEREEMHQMHKVEGIKQDVVARKFGVDRSTVSKAVKLVVARKLAEAAGEVVEEVPKATKGGTGKWPQLDHAVGLYWDAKLAEGVTPSDDELIAVTREESDKLGYGATGSGKYIEKLKERRTKAGKANSVPAPEPVPTPLVLAEPLVLSKGTSTTLSKSYSAADVTELSGPSHARQRSQSSPHKPGLPHPQLLPIQQHYPMSTTSGLTRSNSSNSIGGSARRKGHRSRASMGASTNVSTRQLGRSAFMLDPSLPTVQESGLAGLERTRPRHSRNHSMASSFGHMTLGSAYVTGSQQYYTPPLAYGTIPTQLEPPAHIHYTPVPPQPSQHEQPTVSRHTRGPSDAKRARYDLPQQP